MTKIKLLIIFAFISLLGFLLTEASSAQSNVYARRIFPIFSHIGSCSENQIGYDMLAHELYICKNTGWTIVGQGGGGGVGITNINGLVSLTQTFAVGSSGTNFNIVSSGTVHTFNLPNASATVRGLLTSSDWAIFNAKQSALGFTPENIANKNLTNGYAGLSSGKIAAGQMQEVLSVGDLTEYNSNSGSGNTAIRSTINSPNSGQLLGWNGTNWVNTNPLLTSVFGRNGVVVAQTGDYTAAQITNSFDRTTANTLTNLSTPGAPSTGFINIWADGTDKILKVRDSDGNISTTIRAVVCSGTDKLRAIGSDGIAICAADQTGGVGSGLLSLNSLTQSDQTFSRTNDTNVTLTINSSIGDHNFVLGWTGTLADARVANILSLTQIPNLTVNGFIKTSSSDGTLIVDTTTYLSSIANNSINGAMIALGSDTQGDIMFYNGTDWVRLAAGTVGNVLVTQGTGANPMWTAAGAGDMILASSQTVTGAKTFSAAKLIAGASATDPVGVTVVPGAFYHYSGDNKLYFGVDDTVDFWGEVFIAGKSLINLATNVTGDLPFANIVQSSAASKLIGRGSASGAGDFQEITIGSGLSMSGTTLSASGGSGDFVGPASSTDNAIVRFDGTTGKLGQNSLVTIDDSGNISTPGTITVGVGSGAAGVVELPQGTAPSLGTNSILLYAPTSVTSYGIVYPSVAASGIPHFSNSSNIITMSISAINLASADVTGDLPLANFVQASAASKLLGRGSASGAGDFQEISLDSTLSLSGTTLAVNSALAVTSLTVGGAAVTNNIPQNSQSAAYTTVLADAGKHLYHPSADTTARTFTIDSNANVAYPVGTAITFVNDCSAGAVTISITSDTLVLAGAGTTGSRTLAACGVATAIKVTSTRWIINGTGLT